MEITVTDCLADMYENGAIGSYGQVKGVNTSLVEVRNNGDKEKYQRGHASGTANEAGEKRCRPVSINLCSNIDLQTILIYGPDANCCETTYSSAQEIKRLRSKSEGEEDYLEPSTPNFVSGRRRKKKKS
ncbi:hypothetical protein BJ322DRAFT_1019947 [Thelephora terrestris]|uniref:Uncharacterized protein n=1 Tax=Thelephora terrestris TaxID=56493 RepID=A0A9P6HHS2_9AGAM|nr:hypothetical protein BJ322DRAFT_1019947 [Thelephora terrestris]